MPPTIRPTTSTPRNTVAKPAGIRIGARGAFTATGAASSGCPQFTQNLAAGAIGAPHSGQNFIELSILASKSAYQPQHRLDNRVCRRWPLRAALIYSSIRTLNKETRHAD